MKSAIREKPLVSIIIPAYNEEKNIATCLTSIANQSYQKIEVIIIDDQSKDDTFNVAQEISKKKKIKLTIVKPDTHQERGIIRNLGAKLGKGENLLFIDADMKLSRSVIQECVDTIIKDNNTKAVIIPELSFGTGFWTKCRELEKRCYIGDDRIEAARFFDKKIFWSIGGWDSAMISGEDWDLTRRIRDVFKVARINDFIYHNEGRLTLLRAIKKKFYYAAKSDPYLRKNPISTLNFVLFVFRPAYLRNWQLLLSNPIHAMGMFFLKLVEFLVGAVGFLYGKFQTF